MKSLIKSTLLLNSKVWIFSAVILYTYSIQIAATQGHPPECNNLDLTKIPECIDAKIGSINYREEFENIKDEIGIVDIVKDYVDNELLDFIEDQLGMSIGALVVVIIIVLSLPSLLIIGSIFLCCWLFNLCCFSKKYQQLPPSVTVHNLPPPSSGVMPLSQQTSAAPPLIPRFTTKPSATQTNSYGYPATNHESSWRSQPGGGHNNPSYQPQLWND